MAFAGTVEGEGRMEDAPMTLMGRDSAALPTFELRLPGLGLVLGPVFMMMKWHFRKRTRNARTADARARVVKLHRCNIPFILPLEIYQALLLYYGSTTT